MLIIELSSEKRALQNIQNDCYEGLSDSCRVHQIRFRPGLRPGPRWGSSRRSPRPSIRLGEGHLSPFATPLDAFGVSVSSPAATRPRRLVPKTPSEIFFWIRPCMKRLQTATIAPTLLCDYKPRHVRALCGGNQNVVCNCCCIILLFVVLFLFLLESKECSLTVCRTITS